MRPSRKTGYSCLIFKILNLLKKENSTNNCTSQEQDIVTDQSPGPGGQTGR